MNDFLELSETYKQLRIDELLQLSSMIERGEKQTSHKAKNKNLVRQGINFLQIALELSKTYRWPQIDEVLHITR